MSRSVLAHLQLVGPLTVAAALGIGTLPALAQTAPMASDCSAIHFELANPSAGSMIAPGSFVLQGLASDSRAQDSLGVDRIDFFLDSREQGGVNLGEALPGMVPGPFGPTSFQTTVSIPNVIGGHDLFAYAHSSVSGAESVISVPVVVGEDPAKVGNMGTTTTETCMLGNPASTNPPIVSTTTTEAAPAATTAPPATAPMTPATTAPATTTTTTVAPMASTITLDVGNPSAGDTIHAGGYTIDGMAFDKVAQTGSGVDRIEIFLDSRDAGGMILTDAMPGPDNTWHVIVPLPTNQTGLHSLFFYAHSSVTDQETVVTIPVTIAP